MRRSNVFDEFLDLLTRKQLVSDATIKGDARIHCLFKEFLKFNFESIFAF